MLSFVMVYQEELKYVCAQCARYECAYMTWRQNSACSVEVSGWLTYCLLYSRWNKIR